MINSGLKLGGLGNINNLEADLWEVYPGAEWPALAGCRLPNKTTVNGRNVRRKLLESLEVTFPDNELPTDDQNDALIGAYLAWCLHNRSSSVQLIGDAPFITDGEIREGFILHSCANRGLSHLDSDASSITNVSHSPNQRNDSNHKLLLKLTDFGLVHGTEPENAWLIPGQDYEIETISPHMPISIKLIHSTNFPGGRGWRAAPTIRSILNQLGLPVPQHIANERAITLCIRKTD